MAKTARNTEADMELKGAFVVCKSNSELNWKSNLKSIQASFGNQMDGNSPREDDDKVKKKVSDLFIDAIKLR